MKSQNQTLQPQKNNKEDLIDHSIFPLCLMGKQAQFNLEPNTPISLLHFLTNQRNPHKNKPPKK